MVAAVVDNVTKEVVSLIVADANIDPPLEGYFLVNVDDVNCKVGWFYDSNTGVFADPNNLDEI